MKSNLDDFLEEAARRRFRKVDYQQLRVEIHGAVVSTFDAHPHPTKGDADSFTKRVYAAVKDHMRRESS